MLCCAVLCCAALSPQLSGPPHPVPCLARPSLQALHMALVQPHQFLPGLPAGVGFTASQEDACLAYGLFDQVLLTAAVPLRRLCLLCSGGDCVRVRPLSTAGRACGLCALHARSC